ncbi:Hypothetical protein LUCI_3341 [Lucifera butyrica]|uniref:Uncharacterized protein n=1 Tax=Lucifera butyrica TaxID=1351585 RepID=A0A498R5T2_9FIRM|nr:MinD/ParA family protein [Lucifera butyrica]VBB08076.1 Hypothetical protein LUCI_3341 [Lucifera butyrica]
MRDQAEKLRRMAQDTRPVIKSSVLSQQESQARVIAVTSGKGGVGKTNFTVNLALALAARGQRVLIIDADLGLANVDVVLGCSAANNILSLMNAGLPLSEVVMEGPRGVKFISGGSGIYHLANMTEQQLQYFITQITKFDTLADIILIDTGAGLSRSVLNFVLAADEVILITTPEPTAITDAYAMIKAYVAQQGKATLQLVVNRVADKEEGRMVVDKLTKVAFRFLGLSINSLGFVNDDRNLVRAVKNQTPVLLSFPDTVSAHCIERIAHRLLYDEDLPPAHGIKGFFSKFVKMMQ